MFLLKKIYIELVRAIFIIALLIFFVGASVAEENKEWADAYVQWEKATNKKDRTDIEKCQDTWNFFWPWAKRGNLEARAFFYVFMTMPHHYRHDFPALPSDFASLMREAMIFQVHSAGVQYDETVDDGIRNTYSEMSSFYEKQIAFWDGLNGGTYMACIKKTRSREVAQVCTEIAVQEGLVPSFDSYAKEVDALIAQGLRPLCVDRHQGNQSNGIKQ